MKAFNFFGFALLLLGSEAIGQCANNGLKIQSATCEPPKNLEVRSVDCTETILAWKGGKRQVYLINVVLKDSTGKEESKTWQVISTNEGIGETMLTTQEGVQGSWSLQAVCASSDYKMYSAESIGPEMTTPICHTPIAPVSFGTLAVFPNPANDLLSIDYVSETNGSVFFEVSTMEGKKVMRRESTAKRGKNSFTVDIRILSPGTYLITSYSKAEGTKQTKFVKLKQ